MRINERLWVAAAYLFGIPALYIVLVNPQKEGYKVFHGRQAFVLWVIYFAFFFGARFLIDLTQNEKLIPQFDKLLGCLMIMLSGYALFCAWRGFRGQIFRIPR